MPAKSRSAASQGLSLAGGWPQPPYPERWGTFWPNPPIWLGAACWCANPSGDPEERR